MQSRRNREAGSATDTRLSSTETCGDGGRVIAILGGEGSGSLEAVQAGIVSCKRCRRLRAYCRRIAEHKKREFRAWSYWGKPVPGFGDPGARLLAVGLAPAAHGGNRTGRVFTGDSSGDWLYQALYRFGFANQPRSVGRDDGLQLRDCYVTAACAAHPQAIGPPRGSLTVAVPGSRMSSPSSLTSESSSGLAASPATRGSGPRDGGIVFVRASAPPSATARSPPCRMEPCLLPATIPVGKTPTPEDSRGRCGTSPFAKRAGPWSALGNDLAPAEKAQGPKQERRCGCTGHCPSWARTFEPSF
jgi:hypothetical protein